MKAKEYAQIFNEQTVKIGAKKAAEAVFLRFMNETDEIRRLRNIRKGDSLMALLRERDNLWRKIANATNALNTEAFDKFLQSKGILIY